MSEPLLHPNPFISGAPTRFAPGELEKAWLIMSFQLNAVSSTLTIPGETYDLLDEGAKHYLAQRMVRLLNRAVLFVRDGTHEDRYLLGPADDLLKGYRFLIHIPGTLPVLSVGGFDQNNPPATFETILNANLNGQIESLGEITTNETQETSQFVDDQPQGNRVRRPMNAWILFRRSKSGTLRREKPYLTNGQISQILAIEWHALSAAQRNEWKSTATTLREEHRRVHPGYTFQPRRPHQIKRRNRAGSAMNNSGAINTANNSSCSSSSQELSPTPSSVEAGSEIFSSSISSSSDSWVHLSSSPAN